MSVSTDEIDHLLELLEPLGALRAKRMFGGWGIYCDSKLQNRMFAIVIDGELGLKTDDENRSRFEAAGCTPCLYEKQGQLLPMSYWHVPDDALDSPEAMRPWATLALQAADRARAKQKPVRRKKAAAKKRS